MFILHLNIIQLGLLLFQPHHLLGCDPTFTSASPHPEPEGDLLVLHFVGRLQRESRSRPGRMLPADMVTDRLPWLSYHSADAVHSKGTVL